MAVFAVANVVIQKLTDMLTDESINGEKLIAADQFQKMKTALEEMREYITDAENKQGDETIKFWVLQYLQIVYDVEDAIESFAFRIARQRKSHGFLMRHAFFLKHFTAWKELNQQMNKILLGIDELKQKRPNGVNNSTLTLHNGNSDVPGEGVAENAENDISFASAGGGEVEMVDMTDKIEDKEDRRYPPAAAGEGMNKKLEDTASPSTPSSTMGNDSLNRERLWGMMGMVGFTEEFNQLIGLLTKEGHGSPPQIISIFGEMGSGKTTLTQAVLSNRSIKDSFLSKTKIKDNSTKGFYESVCARVKISQHSTSKEILLKLLDQIGDSMDQGGQVDEQRLVTRLAERLKEKKYLIVLDDFCHSDMWEKSLKNAFPDNRYGSKIVITTSHEDVRDLCAEERARVRLKRLSVEDSCALFSRKARREVEPGELIQKICGGLPLNIVLLGSLLSTKEGNDQWSSIINSQENWHASAILEFSYNNLPSHLKLCTLFMVLFPKENDISVRRLLRLWLAEGFVQKPDKPGISLEDAAQRHFDELFQRSLIQISKQRSDGNHIKNCHLIGVMHDYLSPKVRDIKLFHVGVLHDYLSPKARDLNLFDISGLPASSTRARRLVEYVDSKISSSRPNLSAKPDTHTLYALSSPSLSFSSDHTDRNTFPSSNSSELKYVRSYLSFKFQKKDIPAKGVRNVLKKMISNGFSLLRTLDLEGVYKPDLPDNLGDFFNLRYLGLRWTFLDTLPSSVGKLTYLETLDIKHTYIKSLPNSIWKLKHLRNLNLNEMLLDMPVAPPSSFPLLLTLSGLSIDRECMVNHGLNGLSHLRELGITFHLSNSDALIDWISKLTTLKQLMLRSKDDTGRPSDLRVQSLSKLEQLSNIDLLGKLPKLPVFPQKIEVLSLAVSQLNEDPMPTLGKLECLTVLRLLANSYLGKKIVCPKGGFKKLRVLKLWMLRSLEEWVLEDETMEALKELNIRCCPELKHIPRELLDNEAFIELTLTNMPKIRQDVESEPRHFSLIVKDHRITALPWTQGNDSFEGMLPEENDRTRPDPQASENGPRTEVVTTLALNNGMVAYEEEEEDEDDEHESLLRRGQPVKKTSRLSSLAKQVSFHNPLN